MAVVAAAALTLMTIILTASGTAAAMMPPEWNLPGLPPAWGAGAGGNHRCVPIPATMQLCSGIGYSEMRLPNMLNHESPKEVQDQTEHWLPLVNTACHREIRVLLCSIYAPVCIKHLPEKSIKPCRTLCQAVKDSCLAIMEKFGFAWPDMLNCAQFPPENDLMCIKRSVSLTSVAAQSSDCQTCVRSPTYESLISGYCMNDVVLKARIEKVPSPAASDPAAAAAAAAPRQLLFKGKPRFFSPGGGARLQGRRDRRHLTSGRFACAGGCPLLDEAGANPKRRYLVMGSLRPDGAGLDVKLLVEWSPRQPAFRRAVRSIRRDARQAQQKERGLCRGGQRLLNIRPLSTAATPPAGSGLDSGGGGSGSGGGGGGAGDSAGRRQKKRKGKKNGGGERRRGGGRHPATAAAAAAAAVATALATEASPRWDAEAESHRG